jgi:DNA-binding PadR family transcriptional regulator
VRKYYALTASGRATVEAAEKRYPLLARLIPAPVGEEA